MMHGVGIFLLTAVAGYWVLERSSSHKGQLKSVGQILGWVVILGSLLSAVCSTWCAGSGKNRWCPYGKAGKSSPVMPVNP